MDPTVRDGWDRDELVFLPLGGAGEIGMNLNLYGYGGKWLMVDLGITFADDTMPGIDIVTPDPTYIAERRDDLLGIVITHAHEDHLGAVPHLWERLRQPIYATPFAAAVLRGKLTEAGLADEVPLHEVPLGGRIELGPFVIDLISITHSIPEPNALAIRTPAGVVLHTGDWKLDPTPMLGSTTDETALRQLGDEGVLALVCDSTNVFNPGESGSEATVRENLMRIVAERRGRIAVTTFASNVARIATVAEVARANGREIAIVGRSLWRMIAAARQTGYFDFEGPLLGEDEGGYLPADKVLYLCTGCQGEPRAAMARIAAGDHPQVVLDAGDTVVFSSKIIPGNERPIGQLHDRLALAGIEVITERDSVVHVSGHPNRDELSRMYQWSRPSVAVPVHGEMRHLIAHAAMARSLQVPQAIAPENGQVIRLGPGVPQVVGEVQAGRWLIDGRVIVPDQGEAVRTRRRLMYNGGAVVTLIADAAGRLLAEPSLVLQGIPVDGDGPAVEASVRQAIGEALRQMPPAARRDDARMGEAARLAVRRLLKQRFGKRPLVEARVVRVGAAAE